MNTVQCHLCGKTLNWFNYRNIWVDGNIAYRVCAGGCKPIKPSGELFPEDDDADLDNLPDID